jgi:hypothetical protein
LHCTDCYRDKYSNIHHDLTIKKEFQSQKKLTFQKWYNCIVGASLSCRYLTFLFLLVLNWTWTSFLYIDWLSAHFLLQIIVLFYISWDVCLLQ